MSTSHTSEPPNDDSGLSPGEMLCPACKQPVKKAAYITHLASRCPARQRASYDAEQAQEGSRLYKEYAEELERERSSAYGRDLEYRWYPDVLNSSPGEWVPCATCAEIVKADHMRAHRCATSRLYVREAYRLGITGFGLVKEIEHIVSDGRWYTASQITRQLSQKLGRRVSDEIVNSVLHSFEGRRFESDEWSFTWRVQPAQGSK